MILFGFRQSFFKACLLTIIPQIVFACYISININKKKIKIYPDDILYVESKLEYIGVCTKDKLYFTKYQLFEFEAQLDKNRFLWVHRPFVVARNKIGAFSDTDTDICGIQIPIGKVMKNSFF